MKIPADGLKALCTLLLRSLYNRLFPQCFFRYAVTLNMSPTGAMGDKLKEVRDVIRFVMFIVTLKIHLAHFIL